MAIEPISQFRSQDNSLQQILNGAQQTISGILNNAIQLGRDRVNNQMRQDEGLMQQRQFETGLAQRRADNLSSSIVNAQNTAQTNRDNDRKFNLLNQQNQFTQNRTTTQDAFNNGVDTEKLGLAKTAQQLSAENTAADNVRQDRALALNESTAALNQDVTNTKLAFATADESRKAATFAATGGTKPLTRADIRADERLGMAKQSAAQTEADKQMKQMVIGDTSAFIPQGMSLPSAPAKDADPKAIDAFNKQKALAEAYDKNPFESELQSAKNQPTAEAYANLIKGASPTIIKKRKDFWTYANTGAATTAPAADAPLTGRYTIPSQ